MIHVFIHKTLQCTSEDLNELKIPEMQVSTKLQSCNRAIFSLAHLESTVVRRAAWIFQFFSAVWCLFRKIVLLRYSPCVSDHVELKDVQIQCAIAKFYAKMRIGKGSAIGMLAGVYCCYWLWFVV